MDEKNVLKRKQRDSYEEYFPREAVDELFESVMEMERHSEWIPGIRANEIRLMPLEEEPIYFAETVDQQHLDDIEELAEETAKHGAKLIIYTGCKTHANGRTVELVRNTAMDGIERVAKLSGSALSRMNRRLYSETMNNAFSVGRGTAIALLRYGKLSALHSGADGGYMVMPISRLLEVSADSVTRRFGEAILAEGYNSHSFTRAFWELPDAQDRLIEMYQKAIEAGGIKSQYAINFMPGVDFHSSDTATSCATLDPIFFKPNGTPFALGGGVHVKHLRRGDAKDKDGLELFAEGADGLFAKFEDATKVIAALAGKKIHNPGNCCISLCNRYSISKKYGQAALEEVERIAIGESYISAHDLYLAMTEILSEAERSDASLGTMNTLEEALAKVLKADFSEHDVYGTVAWKNSSQNN